MPWELRPANFSQNESSHQDPNDVILDSLIKNFEQLVWFDFVGLAYQFCLVVFGTFRSLYKNMLHGDIGDQSISEHMLIADIWPFRLIDRRGPMIYQLKTAASI